MAYRLECVNDVDDPRRCQGNTISGQCWYVAMDGSRYCPRCLRGTQDVVAERSRADYVLTNPKFAERYEELKREDEGYSLKREVLLLRVLFERVYNDATNAMDGGPDGQAKLGTGKLLEYIQSCMVTLEKLSTRSQILEQNSGLLFHRSLVRDIVNKVLQIVNEEVRALTGGNEAMDSIKQRCGIVIRDAKNPEQVRSGRLITQE
jgi:hypothetical protein